ncbi:hypothetical protein G7Y89_g4374 [Cudoniella acicularis]|uniref:Polymerase nucleotidyl transferase domain-containing protein n=1 Tax=Cudoniella acicularis TaxID=354080 RepID=A0A8H4RPL8_9HELO|nr:hypothetical protein G7Y89_g4374 [Cudoniella acicularis]
MSSSSSPRFRLNSTQTAVALVVPEKLRPEIDSLRKIHDKAYHKWSPHINILYPFVEPSLLSSALTTLRAAILDHPISPIHVKIEDTGIFKHRRNATVFLKPGEETDETICALRRTLVASLRCREEEGTHDGVFRPHLTVGQAGFLGGGIERLRGMVEKLVGMEWEACKLLVLKREVSGEMKMVDELVWGSEGEEIRQHEGDPVALDIGWRSCFAFGDEFGWKELGETTPTKGDSAGPKELVISSYNLMAESHAPPFTTRIPLIIEAISSATPEPNSLSNSPLRILCLQEINDESLPPILSHPFIRKNYPFSTHSPTSLLPSHRNLVTLSSEPFTHYTLQFAERHKSSLICHFLTANIIVANVHLPSALTDDSITAKKNHMSILTDFLFQTPKAREMKEEKIFIAGDFNLTSSPHTIETALEHNLITPITAKTVTEVIDPNIWEDAFLLHEKDILTEEELSSGAGATFDRMENPLAALNTTTAIDDIPQRYDRILLWKRGEISVSTFERFGFPDEEGECGSDHYGVSASFLIPPTTPPTAFSPPSRSPNSPNPSIFTTPTQKQNIPLTKDTTDILPLLTPFLPTPSSHTPREQALSLLNTTFTTSGLDELQDVILAPLGSYALGTWFPDSDIDLLVVGSVGTNVFFEAVLRVLRRMGYGESEDGDGDGVKAVHFVNSLVPIVEVVVRGVKVDLQYCQAGELVKR